MPLEFAGEETTEAGIILPADVIKKANLPTEYTGLREAVVVAAGEGEILPDGSLRELTVRDGQRVLVLENEVLPLGHTYDPMMPYEGIISERSILAIIRPEDEML
jgi:co-chaperonin GroES (HSP10)